MPISTVLGLTVVAIVAAWALTWAVRRYAIRSDLLDHPNERSSHSIPTPRGGGVAIVVSFLVMVLGLGLAGKAEPSLCAAIIGSGTLVATLGFIDDRGHVAARWRFLGHALAAAWALWWVGRIPPVPLLGTLVDLSYFGPALCGLYVVWMVNLFNFMDGIDGIASVEAITAALGGALLWCMTGSGTSWFIALLFAGCVGGFLIWNFPPARIFMGDAGSGFIGLVVALLSLWCGHTAPHLFWSWFILIGCFMVDATMTLVRRVRRGERFFEAHRTHAYQYASRRAGRHLSVTLTCGAINVFWLLPMASLVAFGRLDGVLGVAVAYAPLVWLAFRYKAGDNASQEI